MTYHESGLKLQQTLGGPGFMWSTGVTKDIPHATSPDYKTRLWFTPDGLYISIGRHSIATVFKAGVDYRDMSATKLLTVVAKYLNVI